MRNNINDKTKELLKVIQSINNAFKKNGNLSDESLIVIKGSKPKYRIEELEYHLSKLKIEFDWYTCGSLYIKHSHCKIVVRQIGSYSKFH